MTAAVAIDPEPLFVVRAGCVGDLDFVLASWVESARYDAFCRDAGPAWRAEHRALAQRLVESSTLLVAHAPGDIDAIFGWALGRAPAVLHYVYVKRGDARRLGIARTLISRLFDAEPDAVASLPVEYTHRPAVRGLAIPASWRYVPVTYRQ